MTTYGMTPTGFVPKRLQDIKAEYEEAYRAKFGVGVDLEAPSVFGQTIGIAADREASLWEVLELIYLSQNPNSAEGVQLDNAVAYVGIERLPATKSRVDVAMFTENFAGLPVTVPALTQVTVVGTGDVFELEQATDIEAARTIEATFEVLSVINGAAYIVIINGSNNIKFATGVDTPVTVAAGLVNAINTGAQNAVVLAVDHGDGTFTVSAKKVGSVRATFTMAKTVTGSGAIGTELGVNELGTPGVFRSQNAGAVVAPAGTLTDIATPVTDLDRTTNFDSATPGTEIETDTALRQRRLESLQVAGAGTLAAIRARVLDNVDDVEACTIFENDTDVDNTGTGGLPPHSFEVVVTGGDEQDIADEIWATKPAGIATWGDITKQVADTNGDLQDVRFSRPTQKYAFVKVRYEVYDEENYPGETVAVAGIIASLLAYGNEFRIGQDMIRDRFYAPIYTAGVAGIGAIPTLEIALTDDPNNAPVYGTTDITLALNEIAMFAEEWGTLPQIALDVAEVP